MKLTEQCKIDFENWYIDYIKHKRRDYIKFSHEQILQKFYREIKSMQFGVYVDFFESVGFIIEIKYSYIVKDKFSFSILKNEKILRYSSNFKTRQETQLKTIETINDLYNGTDREL